ncbi:MAG: hypothetical protein HYV35_05355 [Lentisphaerae bacterium]|nr:hypothetical protein [Lentisphaerota bacterium]
MKIWHARLAGLLPVMGLALLLAFTGCEDPTDEDSSGADSYFDNNPYTSASRDTPLPSVLALTPSFGTASIIGQTIAFVVSGGYGAYHWSVSDASVGTVASKGANMALYTAVAIGNNDVIVQDDEGHYAVAHISPVVDTPGITPSAVTLKSGALYASFTVSGGTPPYTWTSGNTSLGTVSYSAASSYVAAYTAVSGAYGVNEITVVDAEGRTASATVTQEP